MRPTRRHNESPQGQRTRRQDARRLLYCERFIREEILMALVFQDTPGPLHHHPDGEVRVISTRMVLIQ